MIPLNDSLKTFVKLDFASKSIVISILILMPFWYVALFLFNRTFITSNPLYVAAIFCFCLTFGWYCMVFFAYCIYHVFKLKGERWFPEQLDYRTVVYYSISSMGVAICLFYILNKKEHLPFWAFLLILCGWWISLLAIQLGRFIIWSFSKKNNTK